MAEDNQNEGDSSGEQREQGGQSAPKQDNNSVSKKVKIIVGLFLMLILTIAILSSIWFNPGDPPPDYFASGKVTCNDWASAPAGYQTAITNTANKIGIQPALLGAIFLDEHNDQWPQQGMNDPWERGGNGIGPFQIEEWDKKWSAYVDRVAKERGYTAPANPGAEKATFDESALLAGSFLRVLAKSEVGDIDPMTTNENEIKCLGAAYNSGPVDCINWRKNNYTGDIDVTDNYHIRTWTNFQKLHIGCQSTNPTELAKKIIKIARKEAGLDEYGEKVANPYKPTNENCAKYNSTVISGSTCYAWCAAFVSWVYKQAGVDIGMIVSAEGMKNYFNNNKAYLSNPATDKIMQGDVLILREHGNSTTSNTSHHVGIVTHVIGNTVYTIDGNTGGDDVEKQKYQINTVLGVGQLSIISNK